MEKTQSKKPDCHLVGSNGNVFSIIGVVSKALKKAGQHDRAEEFQKKAMQSESYDAVLQLLYDYVDLY